MNAVQTPRNIPENIESWSSEIEELLGEWAEVAVCFAYLHNYSQRKYKAKFHQLQVPIIIFLQIINMDFQRLLVH